MPQYGVRSMSSAVGRWGHVSIGNEKEKSSVFLITEMMHLEKELLVRRKIPCFS